MFSKELARIRTELAPDAKLDFMDESPILSRLEAQHSFFRAFRIDEVLMAKKKASGGLEGSRIRVKCGVNSPEFPEISMAGWTGTVLEMSGKPPEQKVMIEWDAATLEAMPAEYLSKCEAGQLYHIMASLSSNDIEPDTVA